MDAISFLILHAGCRREAVYRSILRRTGILLNVNTRSADRGFNFVIV